MRFIMISNIEKSTSHFQKNGHILQFTNGKYPFGSNLELDWFWRGEGIRVLWTGGLSNWCSCDIIIGYGVPC